MQQKPLKQLTGLTEQESWSRLPRGPLPENVDGFMHNARAGGRLRHSILGTPRPPTPCTRPRLVRLRASCRGLVRFHDQHSRGQNARPCVVREGAQKWHSTRLGDRLQAAATTKRERKTPAGSTLHRRVDGDLSSRMVRDAVARGQARHNRVIGGDTGSPPPASRPHELKCSSVAGREAERRSLHSLGQRATSVTALAAISMISIWFGRGGSCSDSHALTTHRVCARHTLRIESSADRGARKYGWERAFRSGNTGSTNTLSSPCRRWVRDVYVAVTPRTPRGRSGTPALTLFEPRRRPEIVGKRRARIARAEGQTIFRGVDRRPARLVDCAFARSLGPCFADTCRPV